MRLTVLNPGGRDRAQTFEDFAGSVDDAVHAPVNYHAYAACTGGAFERDPAAVETREVLVLLRRDLKKCLEVVKALKARGRLVGVALKEAARHQVAARLRDAGDLALFEEICATAHGCLASTPDLIPLYHAAGARAVEFIPTPYPVDDPRWDFSAPIQERRGIFIGTREFGVPSRGHLAALLIARSMGEPVTVINTDGRAGARMLHVLGADVVEGPLPYSEYLALMARHAIVFQLDRSGAPGQVAGDALLCRIPCVGGDGAVERLVYPGLCGHGRDDSELAEIARSVLAGAGEFDVAVDDVSFSAVTTRLASFYGAE